MTKKNEKNSAKEAKEAWKLFHKRDRVDWTKELSTPFPKSWKLAGRCKTTYYSSDKWQDDRSFFERYYHDHHKRTNIWVPARDGGDWAKDTKPSESWVSKRPRAAAVLGYALGFDVVSPDGESFKLAPSSGSLLLCSPDRKRLYVLEDGRISGLIWGPKLVVEDRGIVG